MPRLPDPSLPYFFDQTPDTLKALFKQWGLPAFRASQVMDWVYSKGICDPSQMTNLSAKDQQLIAQRLHFIDGAVLRHLKASDGTQKLLIDWSETPDQHPPEDSFIRLPVMGSGCGQSQSQTETVMIPSESRQSGRIRTTACVSSQIGCPVGCRFCASGIGGLDSNLSAGRILQQVWLLNQIPEIERISNIVFMGMGEPLSNFDAVAKAIHTLTADWGFNISARRITVSTVGMPSPMRRLADLNIPVTLAISLHAPNDEVRRKIIPWAEFVSIPQILEAGQYYFKQTGREITLEYILIDQLNTLEQHARELAKIARTLRSNINLIRYNEVAGTPYKRPSDNTVHNFQKILLDAGINVHIRASRGRDIAAACGQLRHEHNQ